MTHEQEFLGNEVPSAHQALTAAQPWQAERIRILEEAQALEARHNERHKRQSDRITELIEERGKLMHIAVVALDIAFRYTPKDVLAHEALMKNSADLDVIRSPKGTIIS